MKIKQLVLLGLAVILLGSCKKYSDLLNDPNDPKINVATPDLYLNGIQLNFKDFYQQAQDFGAQVTRMEYMGGPQYRNAYSPQSFDAIWTSAYADIFKNVNVMIPIAVSKQQFSHVAIAQILKAYTMVTLVDLFGDVPYREANLGNANLNPKADAGRLVYDSAIAMLDSAIVNLAKTSATSPANDLYYSGNKANWRKLAKTLKLKIYVQTRRVDNTVTSKINGLITENDLINNPSEDFEFKFGTNPSKPNTRDPYYTNNYQLDGSGANDYLSNFYMYEFIGGGTEGYGYDPRSRYYFYRQTTDIFASITNPVTLQFTLPCNSRTPPSGYFPFCILDNGYVANTGDQIPGFGYLGRDHGNNEGLPDDKAFRATWGVYPAGGSFDEDGGGRTDNTMGAKGAGIYPMWMSSFTDFLKAEAAQTLGTDGDPKSLLISGVAKSITTVMSYPATVGVTVPAAYAPTPSEISGYIDIVGILYDAYAGDDEAQLEIIIGQFYRALWGNGLEAYNAYRRTGHPAALQPLLTSNTGHFIRSFYYPSAYVDRNINAIPKPNGIEGTNVKVFWDNLPDNIFDK